MATPIVPSDDSILDLMRKNGPQSVSDIAEAMEVTATAVRQRLNRLMGQRFIERFIVRTGRGRPSHSYALTDKGRRRTGENFADLAVALWQEIREIQDIEVRRGLLQRISKKLAGLYANRINGATIEEKMQSLAELFEERQVPFSVELVENLPILTVLACPYPELAEYDRGVCTMEQSLFSELLGEDVHLTKCRLDGENSCSFELT